jgi:hypothetical protein
MRISVNEHPRIAKSCKVFFDGIEVTSDCTEAKDGDDGYVIVLLRGSDGHFYLDPEINEAARERRCGKVEIVLPNPIPNWIPKEELKAAGVSA